MSIERRTLILADALIDAQGTCITDGAMLVSWCEGGDPYPLGGEIIAIGTPDEIRHHPLSKGASILVQRNSAVMPAMVNAHTHLDLTHIGPQPYNPAGGFPQWGRMIMGRRATTPGEIRRSVRQGVDLAIEGGVVAVGDIAGVGSVDAVQELRKSPLLGVSFLEYFGFGKSVDESTSSAKESLEALGEHKRVGAGLQPHAPYSASTRLYSTLGELGAPLCTHLAESKAEHELIESGSGPMQGLLKELGIWSNGVAIQFGKGKTPVEHLRKAIEAFPMLLVHLNDVADADLEIVAGSGASVAYCPRSSSYFANDEAFGPHRYRQMLDRGTSVVLGTDSVVNLPAREDGTPSHLGVLPEMRLLFERDGIDASTLLEMATTSGARVLGLDPQAFTLREGAIAGLVSVGIEPGSGGGPIENVMRSDAQPHLLGPGARRALSGRGVGA
ncbi:MAG: amidohydrolase family protein [Planctomycetota bacterium]|jgi:cytosine/adenosine deaminase-related metal-dependent hydrolase